MTRRTDDKNVAQFTSVKHAGQQLHIYVATDTILHLTTVKSHGAV